MPFTVVEALTFTGAPSGRLSSLGIKSGHLYSGVLVPADDYEFNAAAQARLEAALDAALLTTSKVCILDEERAWGAARTAYEAGNQAEFDRILDELAAMYAHKQTYAATASMGLYGVSETGAPSWWLDQTTYADDIAAIQELHDRIHQRYVVVGNALESDPRELFDICLYDAGNRAEDSETQVAFQALALADYHARVGGDKPLWLFGNTHSYRRSETGGTAGRPEVGDYLAAMLTGARDADCAGAFLWYEGGFSRTYFDPTETDPLDRPAMVWAVQETDPAQWAGATLTFSGRAGQQLDTTVTPDFTGAASMQDVVDAICLAWNAANDAASPTYHPGTIGGAWNASTSRMHLWLDYTAGDNTSPPSNLSVLTNLMMFAPVVGTSMFAAHMGDSLDPVNAEPYTEADEWNNGYVLDAKGEPVDWLGGVAGFVEGGMSTLEVPIDIDTYLESAMADVVRGSSTTLATGWTASNGNKRRHLIRADLSDLNPGDEITAAHIDYHLASVTGTEGVRTIDVHLMTTLWSEGEATWNSASSGVAWGSAGGDFGTLMDSTAAPASGTTGEYLLDVTNAVADAVANKAGALDILAKLSDESGDDYNIFPRSSDHTTPEERPVLVVTYTPASGGGVGKGTQARSIMALIGLGVLD